MNTDASTRYSVLRASSKSSSYVCWGFVANWDPRDAACAEASSLLARIASAPSVHGTLLQALVQRTGAREMRQQVLHLVGQHAAALQINVLRIRRGERHGDQLQAGLFGRAPSLQIVAATAGGHDVRPRVPTALAQRTDVVARQLARGK